MSEERNLEKLVILEANIPELGNNSLFVPESAAKVSHTILPICYLYLEAEKRGIRLITPDIYLKMDQKPQALLISHLGAGSTGVLLGEFGDKVRPIILTCQESPFIASRFYASLPLISRKFEYSFVFLGMKRMVSKKSIYHQMFFPEPYSLGDFNPKTFGEKKLITMVSSAKAIGDWKKSLLLKLMYGFSVKEIYSERWRAVRCFSRKDGFDLYGRGWDKAMVSEPDKEAIKKAYRGECVDKFKTLKDYKFTLCFENSVFPGYVTEKIFDAIFAGSVPIYYGAPDIKKYIPADAFIDFRDFKDYDALYSYISSMDEERYNSYLQAMNNFISSESYARFSQEYFTREILGILEKEFDKQ